MVSHYEFTPYIWSFVLSAVFLGTMGLYAFRNLSVPGSVPFIVLLAGIMLWVIANFLGLAATDAKSRIIWFQFERALMLPTVSAGFCFALDYAGLGKWVTRKTVSVLAVPPLVYLLVLLTNDTHHLMWTKIWSDGSVHVERGPGSWWFIVYGYLLGLLHLMVLAWLFARSPRHRWIAVWLILSPLMIRAAYFYDIMELNTFALLDLKVVVVNFALLPYVLAVFRFHMFDVVPVVRDTVMEKMADGMMALDLKNRIADINEAAQEVLGVVGSKVIGRKADEVLHAHPEVLRLVQGSGETQREIRWGDPHGRWYEISISPLIDRRGFHLGQILFLHDTTEQKRIQQQLLEEKQTLATLREREILGRELHDGIGQLLEAAQLQTKVALEYLVRGEPASVETCLHSLDNITQEAKESVRDYLRGVKRDYSPEKSLFSTLREYLDSYSHTFGIRTELITPPEFEKMEFDSVLKAELQPIIQEALTNVRRHSGASSVHVILTLSDREICVTIKDNGRGIDPEAIGENQGFGLRSMRGRADMLGGRLTIEKAPGKGTQVVIQVPLLKEAP